MSGLAWLSVLIIGVLSVVALLAIKDNTRRIASLLLLWAIGLPLAYLLNFYSLHSLIEGRILLITEAFGISRMIAFALAAPVTVLGGYLLHEVASTNSSTRFMARMGLAIAVSGWWLLLWAGTRDHMVGEYAKCYIITDRGIEYFDERKLDPRTGVTCEWVKPSDITPLKVLDARLRSRAPMKRVVFNTLDEVQFFYRGSNSVVPMVWYYRSEDGYEFFDAPGVHPAYGARLVPVDPQFAQAWIRENMPRLRRNSVLASQQKVGGGVAAGPSSRANETAIFGGFTFEKVFDGSYRAHLPITGTPLVLPNPSSTCTFYGERPESVIVDTSRKPMVAYTTDGSTFYLEYMIYPHPHKMCERFPDYKSQERAVGQQGVY